MTSQSYIPGDIRHPELAGLREALLAANQCLVDTVKSGGMVFAAGNGGSCADALHFSGELLKSFLFPRPIGEDMARGLEAYPFGVELARSLEQGVPVVVLGQNPALCSAYLNDRANSLCLLAQECAALCRAGDVLVAFSTSGESENLVRAMAVAKVKGARLVVFTGKGGGRMGTMADVELRSPSFETPAVQEHHVVLYHALCALVEQELFGGEMRPLPFS